MKNLILLFCLILVGRGPLHAQNNYWYGKNFVSYNAYFERESGVTFKMPKNFTDLNQYFIGVKIRDAEMSPAAAFFIGLTLKADQDCIVGYPGTADYESKRIWVEKNEKDTLAVWRAKNAKLSRILINHEIKAALGYPMYLPDLPPTDTLKRIVPFRPDTTRIDLNQYITIIAGKKAREMFNADSIFLYDLPLDKPYLGKYPYCTGLVISKKDRAILLFKFFFTAAGRKREEEYINQLSKQVWYDDKFQPD